MDAGTAKDTPNFIIKNMIQNKKYGNYAADSAAKFFHEKNDAADSTACFHSGGAWAQGAQAAPPEWKHAVESAASFFSWKNFAAESAS